MSDYSEKKLREVEILKKVFGNYSPMIHESEKPDFILTYNAVIKFGIEITELYYDGTSARLKKATYINQLLQEQKYWHKKEHIRCYLFPKVYFSYSPLQIWL